RLPPLPTPSPAALADEIPEFAAVQLFVDRVRQFDHNFAPTVEMLERIAQICRELDGLPLAIELAAARARALSLGELRERLHDSMQLLNTPRANRGRHSSLRAALHASYILLTDGERQTLIRLAVFNGGCTLEAAESVCGGYGAPVQPVLEIISRLVD